VKLLQKIANSDTFDEREDFAVFNRYIPKMSKKIANFIDEMLEEDAEWPNSAADPETHGAERDLRIVADYIAKSGSDKGPEFKRTIIAIAKKITRRAPEGDIGYDRMVVGGIYMNMNSLFDGKDVIRAFLTTTGGSRRARMHKKLSRHQSAGATLLAATLRKFSPVLKHDFDGQDHFKYDAESTFDALLECKEITMVVFYRCRVCTFCKENLNDRVE